MLPLDWFVTKTDEKGVFQFNRFPAAAACSLWVTGPGWHSTYKLNRKIEVGRNDVELILPDERKVIGQVVNAKTDDSVAGVEVEIHNRFDQNDLQRLVTGPYRICPQKAVSDATGQFAFEGVPVGIYQIEVTIPMQGTAQWVGAWVDVDVTADGPVPQIQVPVEKGEILQVKTADWASGDGIGQTYLLVARMAPRSARPWFGWGVTTDHKGSARIRVPEGSIGLYACRVPADVDGNLFWFGLFRGTPVKAGQTVQTIAEIKPSPSVKDRLCDPNGRPLEQISVRLNPLFNSRPQIIERCYAQGWANNMGPHHLAVLARDERHNLAAALTMADLAKPDKVRLSPGITLTGQVVDPNRQAAIKAFIALELHQTANLHCIVTSTTTDSESHFEIPAVPIPPSRTEYCLVVKAHGYERVEQRVELPSREHFYWRLVDSYGYQGLNQVALGDTHADQIVKWLPGREGETIDLGSIKLQLADNRISGYIPDNEGRLVVGAGLGEVVESEHSN